MIESFILAQNICCTQKVLYKTHHNNNDQQKKSFKTRG